jgi:hypothetical protein
MIGEAEKECVVYSLAIQPDHKDVRDFVGKALRSSGSRDLHQILDIYGHASRNLEYENVFHRINPYAASKVLKDGRGDCKNLSVVLASALLSIGAEVRIVIDEGTTPDKGHVFVMVKVPEGDVPDYKDRIKRIYRLIEPLPVVEGMDSQLKALAKAEMRLSRRDKRYGALYRRAMAGYKEYEKKKLDGKTSKHVLEAKRKRMHKMIEKLMTRWRVLEKEPTVTALRQALEEKWLWFNGKPIPNLGVKSWEDTDGSEWLVLDLTSKGYPGAAGDIQIDRMLIFRRPE